MTQPAALPAASLYWCRVMHERLLPFRHKFTYRVFSLLLDIDRLPEIAAGSRLLRHNRFGLLGFYDRDHGPRDGSLQQCELARSHVGPERRGHGSPVHDADRAPRITFHLRFDTLPRITHP